MVLTAVLRHSARDPEQASRRHRACIVDRASRVPALARHLTRTLGELSPALPAVPDRLLPRCGRARLSRLAAAGGWLRDRSAHPHRLLLRVPADHPAVAWAVRDDEAAPELDLGIGTG